MHTLGGPLHRNGCAISSVTRPRSGPRALLGLMSAVRLSVWRGKGRVLSGVLPCIIPCWWVRTLRHGALCEWLGTASRKLPMPVLLGSHIRALCRPTLGECATRVHTLRGIALRWVLLCCWIVTGAGSALYDWLRLYILRTTRECTLGQAALWHWLWSPR